MKKNRFLLCSLLGGAFLVGLDQLLKLWALKELTKVPDIKLIPGVLHLLYSENYGAAFSILQNKTVLLVGATSLVLAFILVALVTRKITNPVLITAFSLVLAGGIGNLIDRTVRGFVVDFIYFVPINFPVFNLADCCIVVGTGLIILDLLVLEPRRERDKKRSHEASDDGSNEGAPHGDMSHG